MSKKSTKSYDFSIEKKTKKLHLDVWDTPGGVNLEFNRNLDFAECHCAILVYSIDLESTFDDMDRFLE